jgi:O-antigen/teichoic acid export membrane protein
MINGVAQPVLAKVADDKERQLRIFRKMMRFTAFVTFPVMFGLSLIAPELITIAITDKWLESAFILQILCFAGAFIPITNLCSNLIVCKGKSDIYMWNTIVLGMLQLTVMYLIHPYGIYPMIITYTSINVFWLLIWHHFVRQEIRYKFIHLLMDILPFAAIAGGIMVITHYLTLFIQNLYLLLAGKILLAGLLYIVTLWLSGAKTFKESLDYLKK